MRKKRLDLGLQQKEVAEQIGVEVSTIGNWELNRFAPKIRYLPRIIDFLGYAPYDPPSSFSEWLTDCRIAAGMSQEKLAKALKVDQSTVRKWEIGKHRPTKRNQSKIQKFFCSLQPGGRLFHRSVLRLLSSLQ